MVAANAETQLLLRGLLGVALADDDCRRGDRNQPDALEVGVGFDVETRALVGQGLAGLAEDLGYVQIRDGRHLVFRGDVQAVERGLTERGYALPQGREHVGHQGGLGMDELGVTLAFADASRVRLVGGAHGQGVGLQNRAIFRAGQTQQVEQLKAAAGSVAVTVCQVVGGQGV
jgi:hypothetical protein